MAHSKRNTHLGKIERDIKKATKVSNVVHPMWNPYKSKENDEGFYQYERMIKDLWEHR